MIDFLGYFGAFFIGVVLGLTGSGGSMLTVPILVYLFHISPVMATAYSLFVVGVASLFGAIQNYIKGFVSIKIGLLFAIPSLIGVYFTRKFLILYLPEVFFENDYLIITKDTFLMVLFAVFMVLASLAMINDGVKRNKETIINYPLIVLQLFVIGIIIGLIGAGGGFLIIPTLLFIIKLPIKTAIGTSLFIISINSLIGYLGAMENLAIDWGFLLVFTVISIFGIFVGTFLNKFTNESHLKKGFGYLVLSIAVSILIKELIF